MRSLAPIAIAALALSLAACGKKEEAPAAAASSNAAAIATTTAAPSGPTAGDYAVFDASGKSLGVTTINADGTYKDQPPKGLPVAGLWKMKDGKTCFDPSGKDPEECYADSAPDAEGNFTATDASGAVLTVKPVKK
jgi:predicted small lipoprotein YifL